jgi:hypothetical protein
LIAHILVEAPDALFEQAVRAGPTAIVPMTDMFFGIREGGVWLQKRCSEDRGRKATDGSERLVFLFQRKAAGSMRFR